MTKKANTPPKPKKVSFESAFAADIRRAKQQMDKENQNASETEAQALTGYSFDTTELTKSSIEHENNSFVENVSSNAIDLAESRSSFLHDTSESSGMSRQKKLDNSYVDWPDLARQEQESLSQSLASLNFMGDLPDRMSDDAALRHATPDDAALRHATPNDAALRHATPDDAALRHATPDDAALRRATPDDAAPRHATPDDAALRHATPNDDAPRHTTPNDAAPRHTTPNDAAPRHTMPNDAAPHVSTENVTELMIPNSFPWSDMPTDATLCQTMPGDIKRDGEKNTTENLQRVGKTEEVSSQKQAEVLILPNSNQNGYTSSTQELIACYLLEKGNHVASYGDIENTTGISKHTVRRVIERFKRLGFIVCKKYYGTQRKQGLSIFVKALPKPESVYSFRFDLPEQNGRQENERLAEDIEFKQQNVLSRSHHFLLDIPKEDYELQWPNLVAEDFGLQQMQQALKACLKAERDTEDFRLSLDFAEWELEENGFLQGKKEEKVSNVAGYVFTSLARNGYFRKPVGYVSPEEQRTKEKLEILKAQKKAEKDLEDHEFDNWYSELSKEALEDIKKQAPSHARQKNALLSWVKTTYYPSVK